MTGTSSPAEQPVDWRDIRFSILGGVAAAIVKITKLTMPEWRVGINDALVPCLLIAGYVAYRVRREPEKLDEWGLTTRISFGAIVAGLVLLVVGAGVLAVLGRLLSDGLTFEPRFISQMITYIYSAFPQQFFLCSIVLVSLAKFRPLGGQWRLPLAVGTLFAAAHFWTPVQIPGTHIPLQVVLTFPMGFLVAWYFLRFRTIIPLILCHAVLFVLLCHWVEAHL